MGRVQTPTLGFIVQRELEREAHVPIEYHSVHVDSDEVRFNVRFHEKDDGEAWTDDSGKHNPARTADTELAEAAFNALENADSIRITSVNEGKRNRNPQPPFMTDTLLQTASSTLGWRISKTQNGKRPVRCRSHHVHPHGLYSNLARGTTKIREYIKKNSVMITLGPGQSVQMPRREQPTYKTPTKRSGPRDRIKSRYRRSDRNNISCTI